MSGKNKKTLHEQLEICERRLQGHLTNNNSNSERYFRLLMREAELRDEISKAGRKRGKS